MSDKDHDERQLVIRFFQGSQPVLADDIPDDVWEVGARDSGSGFDHEAHEAATIVLNALREKYDWAEDIDGAGLGY